MSVPVIIMQGRREARRILTQGVIVGLIVGAVVLVAFAPSTWRRR